jgi:cyanophycinase-like exopeptidase
MARLLTIMGSGETAPTMVKVHRRLLAAVGGGPAVLLDTPYGFQENAADISARAQEYFDRSVGTPISVASLRRPGTDAVTVAEAFARVRSAHYVFAGPGSPTYALRVWAGTPLAALLAEKLAGGGGVTFASAAALTLGVATVPVYEVYKAGQDPHWEVGLDLLHAATGLRAAVVPHYDNAEGGHHDTRFCYLGEQRLARMETELPAGAFVLGVDEHTAVVFDLDTDAVRVEGNGTLTVRAGGRSVVFPAGSELSVSAIRDAAEGRGAAPGPARAPSPPRAGDPAPASGAALTAASLSGDVAAAEAEFAAALADRDVRRAVAATLAVEEALDSWSADTLTGDERDRARAALHGMLVRLGEVAASGARDPREVLAPFVGLLLEARAAARAAKDWPASDRIRDGLAAAGVEVRDTAEGQEWHLVG